MDNWQRQHQWSHYSSEEAQQPSQRGAPPTATNPTSTKPPPSIGMLPSGPPPPRGPPPSMVPLPSGPPIPKGPNSTMSNPPSEGVQQSGHPQQMIPPPSGPPPPIGFNPSGPPPPIGFNQSGPPPPIRFNPLRPPPPMGFNPSRPPPTSGFPPPGMEFPQPPYGYPPPPVWGMPPPHRDSNHSFKRKADPPVPPHPGSQFTSNFGQHTNTGPSIEARGPFHAPQPGIASSYRHHQGAPQVPAHREQNGQDQQLIISKMDLSDSPTSKFEKILTEDQQWLQDWLAKRGTSSKTDVKSKEKVSSTARTMTIPEARRLMREAVQLTEQMETIQDELHDIMSDPSDRWQHQYENACHMKNRLNEIKELMEQENTIEMLVKQMKKAHKKRAHIKRCREERARKLREAEEEREQAHVRADQWLAALTKKQLDVIKEKEMKAGADAILGEVRRKIQEATKARNVLQSLTKLRQLRKVAEEKRGMHTSKESDDQFSAETAKLTEIITQQLDIYNTEKNALQVILDMEQEETMEKEKQHQQQREKVLLSRKTKQLSRLLFGYADDLQYDDPLLPFRQFYESAQHNIQSLLQIRHEWDQYLVPENTAGGSTIPAGWVAPSHPTNHVWATALADNQQKS